MSKRDEFVTIVMEKLVNEIPQEQFEIVHNVLSDCAAEFEIEKRCTDIVQSADLIPEWYGVFLARKKVAGRTIGTLKLYNYYIVDFFLHIPVPLEKMDSTLMIQYLYNLQKRKGICNSTLDQCRIILNTFFQWAADEGYIKNNFVGNIDPIKCIEKPREPLTDEEVVMLRGSCETFRELAIIDTFLATGIRIGELANLKWSDINMQDKTMMIFGKGNKYRTVMFDSTAKVSLLKYKITVSGDNPYVFLSDRRPYNNLTKGGISRIISQLNKKKEFSANVTAHVLRHTFATKALARGMSLEKLRILLGHENIATTLIYAKVDLSQVQQEYEKCFGA